MTPPALRRQDVATAHSQAGEAQRSPPPDLGPPPWLRASTATWLPPGPGRARPPQEQEAGGSRRGPSGKPPASPWTGHQIDRLLTPSRYIGRNLHSRTSTRDRLINAKHRIMDGAIASGMCFFPLPPLCTRPNTATPAWSAPPAGRVCPPPLLAQPRAAARVGYHRLGHEQLRPPTATRCSRAATCAS